MNFQMIRVISSPSSSTTGFITLIFFAIVVQTYCKMANTRGLWGKFGPRVFAGLKMALWARQLRCLWLLHKFFFFVCLYMFELLQQYVSSYVVLTPEEFSVLAEKIEVRTFDKREVLLRAGEVEQYMNFVVKGLVRMYFCKGRSEVITNIAREKDLISSSSSFLSGKPSHYHLETLEPTTLLSITRANLDRIYAG